MLGGAGSEPSGGRTTGLGAEEEAGSPAGSAGPADSVDPAGSADPAGLRDLAALRDLALMATDLPLSISDPRQRDNPLVWVNPAFSEMTGYRSDEAVGRNCRFLQGPGTAPVAVATLRHSISSGQAGRSTILNYRKDGTEFWNEVAVSPVFDDGQLVAFVGVHADVSERVRVDAEREATLESERVARREMDRTRGYMTLLAEATTQLSSTLDTTESLERLADLVVPSLADWVVINLAGDGESTSQRLVVRHRHAPQRLIDRYKALQPLALEHRTSVVPVVLETGEPTLVVDFDEAHRSRIRPPEMRVVAEEMGLLSAMYIPLVARQRRVLGTMVLLSGTSGRRFTSEDLGVAADLGRRAGISIDNARLYEQEHRVAEILQRSLLPAIPTIPGITVSAQYLPANSMADVGGDFYEVLALPDGSVGVAVGDVVGHDLTAAAAMGHLRGLLRACAWDDASNEGGAGPERVLGRVDRLVQGLDAVPLATLVYARIVRGPQGWVLTYANAGHPPPLLRLPGGAVEVLDDASGLLLGVSADPERPPGTCQVPVGSILVGFTDGLVERRDEDIGVGVSRLCEIVGGADPSDLDGLVMDVVDMLGDDRDDDVAVIAVRIDA